MNAFEVQVLQTPKMDLSSGSFWDFKSGEHSHKQGAGKLQGHSV